MLVPMLCSRYVVFARLCSVLSLCFGICLRLFHGRLLPVAEAIFVQERYMTMKTDTVGVPRTNHNFHLSFLLRRLPQPVLGLWCRAAV